MITEPTLTGWILMEIENAFNWLRFAYDEKLDWLRRIEAALTAVQNASAALVLYTIGAGYFRYYKESEPEFFTKLHEKHRFPFFEDLYRRYKGLLKPWERIFPDPHFVFHCAFDVLKKIIWGIKTGAIKF